MIQVRVIRIKLSSFSDYALSLIDFNIYTIRHVE